MKILWKIRLWSSDGWEGPEWQQRIAVAEAPWRDACHFEFKFCEGKWVEQAIPVPNLHRDEEK